MAELFRKGELKRNHILNLTKSLFSWIKAIIFAVLFLNICLFPYYRSPGRLTRDYCATSAVWMPNRYVTNMREGYSLYRTDENGYLNDNTYLRNPYILTVGASYTAGREVPDGLRYSDILDRYYCSNYKINHKVYNVAQDGFFFPGMICGFKSLVQEFPDSEAIVLEISDTRFSVTDLKSALTQREYREAYTGAQIADNASKKDKLKCSMLSVFPIFSCSFFQIQAINKKFTGMKSVSGQQLEKVDPEYRDAVNNDLKLIRSEYNGKLIIAYHPPVGWDKEGNYIVESDETVSIFGDECKRNDIIFIDMTEEFRNDYSKEYLVPYGFYNTTIGDGHLNRYGHKIIADALYEALVSER